MLYIIVKHTIGLHFPCVHVTCGLAPTERLVGKQGHITTFNTLSQTADFYEDERVVHIFKTSEQFKEKLTHQNCHLYRIFSTTYEF